MSLNEEGVVFCEFVEGEAAASVQHLSEDTEKLRHQRCYLLFVIADGLREEIEAASKVTFAEAERRLKTLHEPLHSRVY